MNIWKIIKSTFLNACFYFTIAEFVILIFATLLLETGATSGSLINFLNLASTSLVFLACLILSAINFVWRLDYSLPVKILIHYFSMLIAFVIIFIVIPGNLADITRVIALVALYTGLYFVVAIVALVINSIRKVRKSNKLEYKSQFDDLSKK